MKLRILFAASEVAPFAKTGGLADVAGSLPQALAALGHDVRVVLPRYRQVDPKTFGLSHLATFYVPLSSWKERCDILAGKLGERVTVYFINKDLYFNRPELYRTPQADYLDNAERFIFFSRAVPELCRVLDFSPDIIHCNDWQTALVPLYLKRFYHDVAQLHRSRTVLTIHNLGYQGIFWKRDLALTGLGWDVFTPGLLEFFDNINLLKGGIMSADAVTTVSSSYARDIQTAEGGHGLDGALQARSGDLYGIVNGIDVADWDPAHDPSLPQHYSAARLAGKHACKRALQEHLDFPPDNAPVLGMVTRLTDQKGLDILLDALPALLDQQARIVILGTGDEHYHRRLAALGDINRDRLRVLLRYDDALARRIYAGSDLFLMPSQYEPCGLGQMHALRYGSVPVVRRTGGLADTVVDYHPKTGKGTGFLFDEYTPGALVACVNRALAVYRDPKRWKALMQTGMKVDFSWQHSAKEYVKVYQKVMHK
jgi:starch synthase